MGMQGEVATKRHTILQKTGEKVWIMFQNSHQSKSLTYLKKI